MIQTIRGMRELVFAGFLGLGAVACTDHCGDLEEQCGNCDGEGGGQEVVEAACNAVVKADDDDACEAALDSEVYKCP